MGSMNLLQKLKNIGLNLHTTKIADWNKPGNRRHNRWQRVAKKSKGTLTPGNFISIFGAMIAIYGLFVIAGDETLLGVALLALGRLCDLADGMIAEYTGTKSPLGEMVDAVLDKIVLIAALPLLFAEELVPAFWLIAISLQTILNITFSLLAKVRLAPLHPSREGKLSTLLAWTALIGYPAGDFFLIESLQPLGLTVLLLAYSCFMAFLVLGFKTSINYGRELLRRAK